MLLWVESNGNGLRGKAEKGSMKELEELGSTPKGTQEMEVWWKYLQTGATGYNSLERLKWRTRKVCLFVFWLFRMICQGARI